MKRIALLLCLAVVAGLGWTDRYAAAAEFSDVPSSSPYAAYIADLQRLDITNGVAAGQFGPQQTLTRAQFAKFAVLAFHLNDNRKTAPFTDIKGHWAEDYIRIAYQAGIVNGVTGTAFAPDQPVKREEAAVMVWRYAKSQGLSPAASLAYAAAPDDWAVEAVSSVIARGWHSVDAVQIAGSWSYRPQEAMTREEMAALLDTAVQTIPGTSSVTDAPADSGPTPTPTPSPAAASPSDGSTAAALAPWQQAIRDHFDRQDSDFTVKLDDRKQYEEIGGYIQQMLADDDYIHYIYAGMNYSFDGISTVTFKVNYLETKAQSDYVAAQSQAIVAAIVQPDMTDYAKEKAVHDYVVSHVAYDETLNNYTAYDALTKGTAVCQGYALLTYRLLTDAGLPNKIEEGTVNQGELHAWNVVKVAGNWYLVDTTWDDPVPDTPGRVLYNYYNLTDAQMRQDHRWTGTYPAAATDFAGKLGQIMLGGGSGAQEAQVMLGELGLAAETPDFTADTLPAAKAIFDREVSKRSAQIIFRYRNELGDVSSVVGAAMEQRYNISITYSGSADTRSAGYTVVTVNLTYGSI